MAAVLLASPPTALVVSMEYDATGLGRVHIWDNICLAWRIDDAEPPSFAPMPRVLGSLPGPPPATPGVLTPHWGLVGAGGAIMIPDTWRGSLDKFLTLLATDGGADRRVRCFFVNSVLQSGWRRWAAYNLARVAPDPTGVIEAEPGAPEAGEPSAPDPEPDLLEV